MKRLTKYFSIIRLTWTQSINYRFDFLFEIVCGLIPILAFIMLWSSIYQNNTNIALYDSSLMTAYIVYANFINLLLIPDLFFDVTSEIQSGELTSYLVKPVHYIIFCFSKVLGKKSRNFILGFLTIAVLNIFFKDLRITNISFLQILFVIISIIFAFIIYFLTFMILACCSFWFYDISSWYYTVTLVIQLFAGTVVPITLFPSTLKTIVSFLPFRYLVDFPAHILLDLMSTTDALKGIIIQFFWIIILCIIVNYIWYKGLNKYEANGG